METLNPNSESLLSVNLFNVRSNLDNNLFDYLKSIQLFDDTNSLVLTFAYDDSQPDTIAHLIIAINEIENLYLDVLTRTGEIFVSYEFTNPILRIENKHYAYDEFDSDNHKELSVLVNYDKKLLRKTLCQQ